MNKLILKLMYRVVKWLRISLQKREVEFIPKLSSGACFTIYDGDGDVLAALEVEDLSTANGVLSATAVGKISQTGTARSYTFDAGDVFTKEGPVVLAGSGPHSAGNAIELNTLQFRLAWDISLTFKFTVDEELADSDN